MILYLFLFFLLIVAYILSITSFLNKKSCIFLSSYLIILCLLVGLSDMLGGYDRYIYGDLFDSIADDIRTGAYPFNTSGFQFYGGEKGYGLLNVFIAYITANRYIFIFIITVIIYFLLYQSIRDYTENYPLALIVFMGLWFFFTFTYLRQILGATTAWLGIRYIVKRSFWRFLFIWFIAYEFHNSALIFFPMYFIPIKKYSKGVIIGIMIICFLIGLSRLPLNLFDIYSHTAFYVRAASANVDYSIDVGTRYEYFIEAVVFLALVLYKYDAIPLEPKQIVLMNMTLVFCAILLIFMRSDNGGRLSWYYVIGPISMLSYIVYQRDERTLYTLFVLLLSFAMFFRVLYAWGQTGILYPYKTFLTPGHTGAEWVYEKYEYDFRYDTNKFYRR